jgi:hypothetical protein
VTAATATAGTAASAKHKEAVRFVFNHPPIIFQRLMLIPD